MIHRRQPVVTISALQSMHIHWQEVADERRGSCFPFVLFLETIHNFKMVTSSWRPWIKNVWALYGWLIRPLDCSRLPDGGPRLGRNRATRTGAISSPALHMLPPSPPHFIHTSPWPSLSVAFIHQSDWASGTEYTEVQINSFYSKTNLLPVGVVKSLLVHSRKPQSAHFQWVSCPQGSHISMLAQVAGDTTGSPGWSNNASMSAQERAAFPRSTSDPVQSNWNLRTNPLAYSMVGPCKGGYPCPPSEFQSLVCHYFGRLGCRISTRHKSLAQFCSPRVTVSRPCRLSEFTPYRTLMVC